VYTKIDYSLTVGLINRRERCLASSSLRPQKLLRFFSA
jgi:hypothetical protein